MTNNIIQKRIGCLGLSANPPHFGHLAAAQAVLHSGLVDEVWLVPVYAHAFNKPEFAPWHHRVAMTKFLERPGIVVCEIEGERGVVSYTADTVSALQDRYPEYKFLWIIGSDIIVNKEYLQWHEWNKLSTMIQFVVVDRAGYPLAEDVIPPGFIHVQDINAPESSTVIRAMLHERRDPSELVGAQIVDYIERNGLYSSTTKEARNE